MTRLAIQGGKPVRETFLPPFKPTMGEKEISEVVDTLKSGWITTGPKTRKFEKLVRDYLGSQHAIAVSSCTAALHLSLVVIGVGKDDEVITSPLTFASTANVVIHQQAKPVFVDIEHDTYNLDPEKIADKITNKTKAIIPVHYAGHPCEMDEIMRIAGEHNLAIIEDAAHAFGASYRNQKIGNLGHLTCFSFYATKNLSTAEGGMITCNEDDLAEQLQVLSSHGISRDAWKRYSLKGSWFYEVLAPGYKYNFTDIQAALGIPQLKNFDQRQSRRENIAKQYSDAFNEIQEVSPQIVRKHVHHAWHLYPIQIKSTELKINRNELIEALKAENIGTSVHFIPLHLQPYYQQTYEYQRGDFPITESVYDHIISLPIYPSMTDRDVKDVILALEKIVEYYRM